MSKIKKSIWTFKQIFLLDKSIFLNRIIYAILNSMYGFLIAKVLERLINSIENNNIISNNHLNWNVIVYILFLALLGLIIIIFTKFLDLKYEFKVKIIKLNMKQKIGLHTVKMDYQVLELSDTQDLYDRLINNIESILAVFKCIFNVISSLIALIIASIAIVKVNVLLIFIIIIISLVSSFLLRKITMKNYDFEKQLTPINRKFNYLTNLSSNFSIGKDMRIFRIPQLINKEREINKKNLFTVFNSRNKTNFMFDSLLYIFSMLKNVIIYIFIIYSVLNKRLEISEFTYILSIISIFSDSLNLLIIDSTELFKKYLYLVDYYDFMNIEIKKFNEDKIIDLNKVEIEFKNVYFKYYGQNDYALKNISFKVKNGEKITIIGDNGAGKTTLIKLLTRLYYPTQGEILINGVNLSNISKECLKQLFSPIYQEINLFPLSIASNISMKMEYECEKIDLIIQKLNLYKKIKNLPKKEQTILDKTMYEDGVDLSGGEKQKISICRALYKNSPIMIMDEPTSSLDAITESEIYKMFNSLINNKTVIYISHRLASCLFSNQIIYLNKGEIIEKGTHKELMNLKGRYFEDFKEQSKYYKGGEDE